jgi:ribonuclease HI
MQNWLIHFGWVKAHTGIEGNEKADKLTKAGALDADERNIVYNRTPKTIVCTEIGKKWLLK